MRARTLWTMLALVGLIAACSNASDGAGSTATTTGGAQTTSAGSGTGAKVDAPGVTDTEIRYSVIGTKSNNPLGTCVLDCFVDGIQAYFDYRNADGGIYGRKLVISKQLDDELSNNQVRALEVTTANDTFGNFNAAQIANGWETLAKAGIPTYVWMINPAQMTGKDSIWGNREVACIPCTQRGVALVVKDSGAKKVATLGYGVSENSKQCAQSQAATVKKYSSDIGGATVAYTNDSLDFGLPNGIGPEVSAMKKAGVQLITACLDLNGMKTLGQELKRQGMSDVIMMHTNTYDQKFVADAGGIFDGDYVQVSFRPFEADSSASASLAAFQKWMEQDGKTITEMAMVGWINADLAYSGLKGAGANFDRQKVIAATNELKDYTAGGLIPAVDWSRQHEAPTEADPKTHGPAKDCLALVKVVDGKFQMVGDKAKPFECWPGDTRDWSEPVATNFE